MYKQIRSLTPIFILICSASFAQITITNSSMPSSGDSIVYSNALPTAQVNYDTTGAGITWDFSNLTPLNQGAYEYKNATAVNFTYGIFFAFSSYGLKVFDSLGFGAYSLYDGYDFYQKSSTMFKAVGRGVNFQGLPIPSFYSDDDEIYQFPLNYNDYDSSTFNVSFQLSTFLELKQTGSRINDVEGWGTVITPFGSFACLKVKTTVYETDSITFNSFPLPPISRISQQYKWLATIEKIPVFEVDGSVLVGNFIVSNIRYRDAPIPTSVTTYEIKNSVTVSPNPASDYFTVDCKEPIVSMILMDIYGKTISESKTSTMNTNGFERGMYLISVLTKNNKRYSIPVVINN